MANKDLKNRHPFSNSLDNDLWKKFDELSKETGVNKSKLLDKAIELLLNEKESNDRLFYTLVIKPRCTQPPATP